MTVVSELQKNNAKTEENYRKSLELTLMTYDINKCTDNTEMKVISYSGKILILFK